MSSAAPRFDPEKLIDLYKIAVDEYRFEVRLNWDRMMYYLVFNGVLISVGTGLLKLEDPPVVNLFVALVFVIGSLASVLGVFAIRRGHEYYLRTVFKKTLVEDLMGLTAHVEGYPYAGATLAVTTTRGHTDVTRILYDTEQWMRRPRLRRGSIVFYVTLLLWLFAVIDGVGAVIALGRYLRPAIPSIPWP